MTGKTNFKSVEQLCCLLNFQIFQGIYWVRGTFIGGKFYGLLVEKENTTDCYSLHVCTDWIVEKVSDTSTSELMKAV